MSKIFFALILIVLDQLTKHLAPHKICNPYISWSIPLGGWLLILFIFLALILLFYIAKNSSYHYSVLFIIAGAIGNIIDRLYSGCVIDFISFSAIPLMNRVHFLATFPTFNLADTFITIGTIWFLWQESKK